MRVAQDKWVHSSIVPLWAGSSLTSFYDAHPKGGFSTTTLAQPLFMYQPVVRANKKQLNMLLGNTALM
jgi:hypothetical protein